MKARFYVICYNYYDERPYSVPHFDRHSTVRFSDLTDALKYALNDHKNRSGIFGKNDRTGEISSYGGCDILRGKSTDTGIPVMHIHHDGVIEYYSAKAQRVAEGLAR